MALNCLLFATEWVGRLLVLSESLCLNVLQNKPFGYKNYLEADGLSEGGLVSYIKW